jgi:pyruvate,orthophosphate dikinase
VFFSVVFTIGILWYTVFLTRGVEMITKNVYFFGEGKAEGDASMREALGGKGANLAEMTNLGMPVPPGFTVATDVCAAFCKGRGKFPVSLDTEVGYALTLLEKLTGKRFGDHKDALLVSVRSEAGVMDAILCVGLNDRSVVGLAENSGNPRFAWDMYRRFIMAYGNAVMGAGLELFDGALDAVKAARGIALDDELTADDLKELADRYKKVVRKAVKKDFPQDAREQLWGAIGAVFSLWMNGRGYRVFNNTKGVAVHVQSMVFGNVDDNSGTGICFSRDPSTGKNEFSGEYLMNAQDVTAGIRTPQKLSDLQQSQPKIYQQLVEIKNRLEKHFQDMQDIEFTIQRGKLFLLKTGPGKRSGAAAVKCALDMVKERILDQEQAVMRVAPEHLDQLLRPVFERKALKTARALAQGLAASPGAAAGQIVFTAQDAVALYNQGKKVIFVHENITPENIGGMVAAQGILTAAGEPIAAAAAQMLKIPCIVGGTDVKISGKKVKIGAQMFKEGDWISIDGTSGTIFEGRLPAIPVKITRETGIFLGWCDEVRNASVRGNIAGFHIRTIMNQPEDAKQAFELGADGVGLYHTDSMFSYAERQLYFQAMIFADTAAERKAALKKILPLHKKDFVDIFKAMNGKPVVIRLLDAPFYQFVPYNMEEAETLAAYLGVQAKDLRLKADKLQEQVPALGHRGCRIAVTHPEIYAMQVEAIALAATDCVKKKIPAHPEILIPMVCDPAELALIRPMAEAVWQKVAAKTETAVPFRLGAMIETPRAAILAKEIASYADFFSFSVAGLTQTAFACSYHDSGNFLPAYLENAMLDADPFESIDERGVGELIKLAAGRGRGAHADLTCGFCGEQGSDPATIDFCYRAGLSYVSCPPFRVPLARLAGAQAVINNS